MTDVLTDNQWLLTVGTFLPLVGVLVIAIGLEDGLSGRQ